MGSKILALESFTLWGHFDPSSDVTTATTTYSGTIEVTVTITLKKALPKGDSVACNVDATASSVSETSAANLAYDESATSLATVSGSTATCKVNIPFPWVLLTPSTTVVSSLDGGLEVIMYSPTATTITTELQDLVREHSRAITINAGPATAHLV